MTDEQHEHEQLCERAAIEVEHLEPADAQQEYDRRVKELEERG